jgi:hypothetical protein
MKSLILEGNNIFPTIIFDPTNRIFEIKGKSVPEEAELFYREVLNWFDDYAKNPIKETVLNFRLDYFNIASSKRILFILYKLNEMHDGGHKVSVNWYHAEDDDDMREVAEDFQFMVKVPFKIISYSSSKEEEILI